MDENDKITDITEADEKKFNDMKELIGMCIDNTSQISNTIGVTLQITDTMGKINGLMTKEENASQSKDGQGPSDGDLLEDIGQALGKVKNDYSEYCNKIEKRQKITAIEINTNSLPKWWDDGVKKYFNY